MSRVESTVFGRNFLGFFLVFWKAGVRIVFIGYGDSQRVGFFCKSLEYGSDWDQS
jgi:hypothetical protein